MGAAVRVMLATERFPYTGGELAFLPVELEEIAPRVEIHLVPLGRGSKDSSVSSIPPSVTVTNSLALTRPALGATWWDFVASLMAPSTWRILSSVGVRLFVPRSLISVGLSVARARWVRRNVDFILEQIKPDLVYCWWSSTDSLGVACAAEEKKVPVVTRTHGYDLFGYRLPWGVVAHQRELLSKVTKMLSVSVAGSDYLKERHPQYSNKVQTSYLGVPRAERLAPQSSDGQFRIVTCSSMVAVKRLHLLVSALAEWARNYPDEKFLWTHIGGGPMCDALSEQVAREGLGDVVKFLGYLVPNEVRSWLSQNPVDVFVNVSSAEGLAVSLMEAASFGIPLVASNVGGTSEIVSSSNGTLLPSDPSTRDIVRVLRKFRELPITERLAFREASLKTWQQRFDASVNYGAFCAILQDLMEEERNKPS